MRVSTVGEFGLIERLARVLNRSVVRAPILVDIGDDAAAWRPTPGTITVATTDALVEGVHFDLGTTNWIDLGWKSLAENVSDVAAMGCKPRYGLIALGLPPDLVVSDVEQLYQGVADCSTAFDFRIVGGDVVRAPCVVLHVSLIGESLPINSDRSRRPLLERSSARAGDVLAVSGPLGGSAAGLRLLAREGPMGVPLDPALEATLIRAHRRPEPRVEVGLALVQSGVRCAIDVSDGLVADVGHICERSRVDAEIDVVQVPIFPGALVGFGDASLDLALTGGEDYELVCAGGQRQLAEASERLAAQGRSRLVPIGKIVEQSGPRPAVRIRQADGVLRSVDEGGYRHFHG